MSLRALQPVTPPVCDSSLFKGKELGKFVDAISCLAAGKEGCKLLIGTYGGDVTILTNIMEVDVKVSHFTWRDNLKKDAKVSISCMDVSDHLCALGSSTGEVSLWNLDTQTMTSVWKAHDGKTNAVIISREDNAVYSVGYDGYFYAQDMEHDRQIHAFGAGCPVSCLVVQGPSNIYLGTWDGQVLKLDLKMKKCSVVFKVDLNQNLPIRALCCALVVASTRPKHQLKAEKSPKKNDQKIKNIKNAAKTKKEPKDRLLLFCSYGIGDVMSWDLRTNTAYVQSYYGHTDVVNNVLVKNNLLWTVADDQTARLYDPNSSLCLQVLRGHTKGLTGCAICGPYFFTGHYTL